jgi:hypothetical protein
VAWLLSSVYEGFGVGLCENFSVPRILSWYQIIVEGLSEAYGGVFTEDGVISLVSCKMSPFFSVGRARGEEGGAHYILPN